ncbi:MAG TPA: M23 family metallopeptidase, partial [Vulgatibacter sp.]
PRLQWPVQGVLYSRFGARGATRHDGIDIAAPEGSTIVAAADGEVIHSGTQRGYGNLVIVRHEGGLITIYAHNRENLVRDGAQVKRGQPIAKVGRTGRATGPHCHFEVRQGTTPLDPLDFLPR